MHTVSFHIHEIQKQQDYCVRIGQCYHQRERCSVSWSGFWLHKCLYYVEFYQVAHLGFLCFVIVCLCRSEADWGRIKVSENCTFLEDLEENPFPWLFRLFAKFSFLRLQNHTRHILAGCQGCTISHLLLEAPHSMFVISFFLLSKPATQVKYVSCFRSFLSSSSSHRAL